MKKLIFIILLWAAGALTGKANEAASPYVNISMQTFYDELSPYGDWLNTKDYGYVWRPFMNDRHNSFRPYDTDGDWVYTEYGWTWVSNYPWGWAPFHYGRWYLDDYYGWMWMPGYEWAPAWVSWGSYNDNWGWAPMGPGIQVNVNLGWNAPLAWWIFVPRIHFGSNHWHNYIYRNHINVTNINYITNIYDDNSGGHRKSWYHGPRVSDVERYSSSKVRQMRVVDADRAGDARVDRDRVKVYRPGVENQRTDARPAKYKSIEKSRSDRANNRESTDINRDRNNIEPQRGYRRESTDHNNTQIEERNRINRDVPANPGREARKEMPVQVEQRKEVERRSEVQRPTPAVERRVETPSQERKATRSEVRQERKEVKRSEAKSERKAASEKESSTEKARRR